MAYAETRRPVAPDFAPFRDLLRLAEPVAAQFALSKEPSVQ